MSDADDILRQHIAKMETVHGDEPVRIKVALPWARELLEARETIVKLREQRASDTEWLTKLREQLEVALNEGDRLRGVYDLALSAALAQERLLADRYLPWASAGGPGECGHGRAAGVPCPKCDRELIGSFFGVVAKGGS